MKRRRGKHSIFIGRPSREEMLLKIEREKTKQNLLRIIDEYIILICGIIGAFCIFSSYVYHILKLMMKG